MENISIQLGEYKVYATGTIIAIVGNPIVFDINGLPLQVVFKDDNDRPGPFIHKKSHSENNNYTIEAINFKSKTGLGSTAPINFATQGNVLFYFSFVAYLIDPKAGHILHYTITTITNKS